MESIRLSFDVSYDLLQVIIMGGGGGGATPTKEINCFHSGNCYFYLDVLANSEYLDEIPLWWHFIWVCTVFF